MPFGLFLHEFDSLSGKRQHKLISVMSRYNNRFVDLVKRGQEQGKLIEGEPWLIVNGILGMCNWLYRWYDTDHVSSPEAGEAGVPEHAAQWPAQAVTISRTVPAIAGSGRIIVNSAPACGFSRGSGTI